MSPILRASRKIPTTQTTRIIITGISSAFSSSFFTSDVGFKSVIVIEGAIVIKVVNVIKLINVIEKVIVM
jgi:hypothetical protein